MKIDETDRRPVIFINGFGSGKDSTKYTILKNQLDPNLFVIDIIEIDYSTATKNEIESNLKTALDKYSCYPEAIVVGHSLGGYWTRVFAKKYFYSSVIINPSLKPWETLSDRVPIGEYDTVPDATIDRTSHSPNERVYLELGDEVVDQQAQINEGFFIRSCLTTIPNGHHRIEFDDNVIREVLEMDARLSALESFIFTE